MSRPTSRPVNSAAFSRNSKHKQKQQATLIDAFFKSSSCLICAARNSHELRYERDSVMLCQPCSRPENKQPNIQDLILRLQAIDTELSAFTQLNHHHNGMDGPVPDLFGTDLVEMCCSADCPLYWKVLSLRQHEIPLRASVMSALRIFGVALP